MQLSDIMIHVTESLSPEARCVLEDTLRDIDGVIAPRFGAGTDHLLLVAFDAERSHATDLLAAVRQSVGQAQLVAL